MKKKLILIISVVFFVLIILGIVFKARKPSSGVSSKDIKFSSATNLLAEAKASEAKGDLIAAKAAYQKLISDFSGSGEIMRWQKKIEDLNMKLLFSSVITPKSLFYQIKPADTLVKIAREFKTTVDLIKKSNGFNDDKIMPGRKIKVWTAPFSILVDKSQNILILKADEEVFKTYIVSTGANNSTPVGTFKIVNKLLNPTWFKAGAVVPASSPENVLGTRWLGFDLAGYGIHGTTEPQNLGKQVTQGCVRLSNPEVEELYSVIPVGTEVIVVD